MRFECCDDMRRHLEVILGQDDKGPATIMLDPVTEQFSLDRSSAPPVPIRRCPWCGAELPRSRRERWLAQLDLSATPTACETPERTAGTHETTVGRLRTGESEDR